MASNGWLHRSTVLIETVRLQLEQRYNDLIVSNGIERARGAALKKVAPLDNTIRDQAFYNQLSWELAKTEDWIIRMLRALDDHEPELARKEE